MLHTTTTTGHSDRKCAVENTVASLHTSAVCRSVLSSYTYVHALQSSLHACGAGTEEVKMVCSSLTSCCLLPVKLVLADTVTRASLAAAAAGLHSPAGNASVTASSIQSSTCETFKPMQEKVGVCCAI